MQIAFPYQNKLILPVFKKEIDRFWKLITLKLGNCFVFEEREMSCYEPALNVLSMHLY